MIRYTSVNHLDASLDEREEHLRQAHSLSLPLVQAGPHVLLQTCNRVERYWGEGAPDDEVARHLFRVAAGLESAIVGEWAVLGQVKQAYRAACEQYSLSPSLHRLFQWAIHAGKRARAESGISLGAASHSQAAAEIIAARYNDGELVDKVVVAAGVNKLTEEVIKFLKRKGAATFVLANRNLSKAEEMAARLGCTAMSLGERRKLLSFADILVCATAAPHPIFRDDDLPSGRAMTIIDLSFPRNVDPALGCRMEVELFDLEYVERFVRQRLASRGDRAAAAGRIIDEEVVKFKAWYINYLHYKNDTNGIRTGL
ncbi:MAG: hypothetical protein LBH06_04095 [Rikenellaceae bacterium]|jgi:glutamyl-tRNA reductase|nr:hypothetical protein [Rikenellaceae bacterium]